MNIFWQDAYKVKNAFCGLCDMHKTKNGLARCSFACLHRDVKCDLPFHATNAQFGMNGRKIKRNAGFFDCFSFCLVNENNTKNVAFSVRWCAVFLLIYILRSPVAESGCF